MRFLSPIAAMLLSTVVASACGSVQKSAPEPAPVAPEPEPTPPPPDPNQALVDALLPAPETEGAKDIALYAPGSKTAYYTQSWHEEGTGAGLALVARTGGGEPENNEIYTPGDDESTAPAAIAKAKQALLAKLAGQEVVTLEATAWPRKKKGDDEGPPEEKMSVPGLAETFVWKKGKLEVKDAAGKVIAKLDVKKDADPPHKPVPTAVYAREGVRTVLLAVTFDPGDKYGEYNVYSTTYAIELP